MSQVWSAPVRRLSFFLCVLALAAPLFAATITVNTFADFGGDSNPGDGVCAFVPSGGQCTLRAAIMEANALAGADTIILPSGTYTLALAGTGENAAATGDLDITSDITIIGSNGNPDGDRTATIVEAGSIAKGGIDRVFNVNPGGAGAANVTFKAITIRNGNVPGDVNAGSGGGIEFEANGSTSSLTLYNVVVDNNRTSEGGAAGGVDLYNFVDSPKATVTIDKCVISNNETADNSAGAMSVAGIDLTMRDTTLSGSVANSSSQPFGGGMQIGGPTATLTIDRCLFANNRVAAGGNGGAIALTGNGPVVTITNSTFSGNSAANNGGGIFLMGNSSKLTLTNVTMTANTAGSEGGALRVSSGSAVVTNSIVYGNTAVTNSDISGTVGNASSYNMIGSNGTGGLTNGMTGNRIGVDPLLGPLADNGGPTLTHALSKTSPAIEAGFNNFASSYDQRGRARVVDFAGEAVDDTIATVDIGAFELQPSIRSISNRSGNVGATISVPVTVAGIGTIVTATSSNGSVVPNDSTHLSVTNPTSLSPSLQLVGASAGTSTITVTVTSSAGDRDTATFTVTMTAVPDLTIAKSHSGNFVQGSTGTYTITVTNSGGLATSGNVTVTDTLPAGLSGTAMSGTGWTCSLGGLTCTRTDVLSAGSSYPSITLTASVTGSGSVTNVASVAGGGDVNTANNTASDPTLIVIQSDLGIAMTGPSSLAVGSSGIYAITVTNNGPSATSGPVNVWAAVPAGAVFTSVASSSFVCTLSSGLNCENLTALASGATATINLAFTIVNGAPPEVTTTAHVTNGYGTNSANDTASVTTTVLSDPDLTITKSHTGNFREGGTGTYTITVTNNGYTPTSGTITVVDTLPAGMTATSLSGTGWTCDVATATCTSADSLGASASSIITLGVKLANDTASSLTNTVTVSGGGETDTSNNTATDPTTITQVPDLRLTKSDGGATFTQGQMGTYTLTVTNVGQGPTSGTVSVQDPGGSGFGIFTMAGSGWNCNADCWRRDALAPGASYPPITVTVRVDANAPRTITNSATVFSPGELETSNNTGTDTTDIRQLPDLTIAATGPGTLTRAQSGAQFHFTVQNGGTGLTTGAVNMTIASLDASLTPTGLTGAGWTCSLATLTCTRSDELSPGGTYDGITLTADVAPNAPSSATTVASISGGDDQRTDNNTASVVTPIATLAPVPAISAPTITFGNDASVVVTVTPSDGGTATGTVSLSIDGGSAIVQSLASGVATFTIPSLGVGTHTLDALYNGDSRYDANSATGTLTVDQAIATVTIDAPSIDYGADENITVTVSSPAGTPTGTISVTVNGVVRTATLTSGVTTVTYSGLTPATYNVDVTYGGDTNFSAASATTTFTVRPASPTVTIDAPTIVYGNDATVTVTVASPAGVPTGNLTLEVDGAAMTNALVSRTATFTIATPGAGDHALIATYGGDTNFRAVTANGSLHIDLAPTTISMTSVSPSPSMPGDPVTIHFSTTASSGDVTIGAGALSCTASVTAGACTITFNTAGTYDLVATYNGNSNYQPSTSATFTHRVEWPVGSATLSGDATICAGVSATLRVALTGDAPWTLTWSDGIVEHTSNAMHERLVSPETTTLYTLVHVEDAHVPMTVNGSANVRVRALLTAPVITGPASSTLGQPFELHATSGFDFYVWYRNGVIIEGVSSATYSVAVAHEEDLASYSVMGFRGGCTSGVSEAFVVSASDAPEQLVAAVVGSAHGANGSMFRSALHLFNGSSDPFAGTVGVHAASSNKSALSADLTLVPHEVRWIEDLFTLTGGEGLGSADLFVREGQAPLGLVHVYNDAGERGTTGLLQPLVDARQSLQPGDRAVLIAPADPVTTRFNLGVRTLASDTTLRFTLRNAAGEARTVIDHAFAASSFMQTNAGSLLGVDVGASDSLLIEVTSGNAFVYGASTDNRTNDPNIQFAQRVTPRGEATRRILAVAGSTPGAFGSQFRTAVQLYNSGDAATDVAFRFRPAGASSSDSDATRSVTVAPKSTLEIHDLLPSMNASGIGTVDVMSSPSILAVARVYNDAAEGQTSMTEELLPETSVVLAGAKASLIAPHDPQAARFNIGVRTLESGARVIATVRSSQGVVLATKELVFAPTYFVQTSASDQLGHAFTGDESITYEVKEGSLLIYGVWTDNITNDPSFHFAR